MQVYVIRLHERNLRNFSSKDLYELISINLFFQLF